MRNKICLALDLSITALLFGCSFWFNNGFILLGALGWLNLVRHDCDKIRESRLRICPPERAFPVIVQEKLKSGECFALGTYKVLDGRRFALVLRMYKDGKWFWVDCDTEQVIPDNKVKNYRLM